MDFTQSIYKSLLESLISRNYFFSSFKDYIEKNHNHTTFCSHRHLAIIRHDVDRLPQNSLKLAQFEYSLGIKGTYYFRIVPGSYNLEIMEQISALGHEIGYHYEDVDLIWKNAKGKKQRNINEDELIEMAYDSFCENLELFRKNFNIKTICMHGSPRAQFDNKIIWQKYNYKNLGIIGEPYYDIDFNEFAYFTDTGRRWDGNSVSVRDKVESKFKFKFKTTQDIINNIDKLPNKIMFTIHPERWSAWPVKRSDFLFHGHKTFPWVKELVWQNIKNIAKKYFFVNK